MSRAGVQFLVQKYKLRPDPVKGQHFLCSDALLDQIVELSGVDREHAVLEIGAGIGNLTTKLAARSRAVVAVEIDTSFKPLLDAIVQMNPNVSVLYRNILSVPFPDMQDALGIAGDGSYGIVANIPYYITSRLIFQVLHYPVLPHRISLLVQREVGERIIAHPGSHSKLSLGVQLYGQPAIVLHVSRNNFYPEPDVDSVLLSISDLHPWNMPVPERYLWQFITFGFSGKRKTLLNNLAAGLREPRDQVMKYLAAASLDQYARAQELSVEQWIALAAVIPQRVDG